MFTKKAPQLNYFLIHSHRPGLTLTDNMKDKEFVEVKEAIESGNAPTHPRLRKLDNAAFGAEGLPWSEKRVRDITTHVADEHGDFYIEDVEEAKAIMERLSTYPAPKATLDPYSPSLDTPVVSKTKKKATEE